MAKMAQQAMEFVAEKLGAVKKPEASLDDVSVKHLSLDGATFLGQLEVQNPYGHDIPICEVSYGLRSAGRQVVSGTLPDPGSLRAKETTRMEIPLKVPYDILVSLARDIGRDWDIDYEMDIGLTIDLPVIGSFTLPVSKKGVMKLPTLSDVF